MKSRYYEAAEHFVYVAQAKTSLVFHCYNAKVIIKPFVTVFVIVVSTTENVSKLIFVQNFGYLTNEMIFFFFIFV